MTETSQVLDGAETVADATVQTVNRQELNEASPQAIRPGKGTNCRRAISTVGSGAGG